MSSFGISRVTRDANKATALADGPGPGSFEQPGAMKMKGPAFTPFGTSSNRASMVPQSLDPNSRQFSQRPGPGDYDISIDIANAPDALAASTFKSKTQRFVPLKKHNGPESYNLGSTVKNGRPKQFARQSRHNGIEELANFRQSVPSIPNKFQSTGYEAAPGSSDLVLQDAVEPGFDGTPLNMVGPGDYDPKYERLKYGNAPIPTMRGSERSQLYKMMEKASGQAPGPGYYNYRGIFDQFDDTDQTNMVVRLNAAKKRLSASFESKTTRNAMLNAELKPRLSNPGPGHYNISQEVPEHDPNQPRTNQNFLSGGPRFREDMNAHNNSAPGAYLLPSEFDANRTRIIKAKKLKGRSGWAQNISFDNTEKRFFKPTPAFEAPPPGLYNPTNFDLASGIEHQSKRTPGFGSNTSRSFDASERNKVFVNAQEQLARELEEDIRHGIGPSGKSARKVNKAMSDGTRLGIGAGSAFGVGLREPRFSKSLEPVGPPPGAYDTRPKWDAKGAVPFKTANPVISRGVAEMRPGPGDYILPPTIKIPKPARNNVMVSTGKREGSTIASTAANPGPGSYRVSEQLLRKSFNILLNPDY